MTFRKILISSTCILALWRLVNVKHHFVFLLACICIFALVECSGESDKKRTRQGSPLEEPKPVFEENYNTITAMVVKMKKGAPYDYTLDLLVDSAEVIRGSEKMLQAGQQITVVPNYIYLGPDLMDMSKATNQSLMALATIVPGQRISGTVALALNGEWMLLDGKKE